jgi:serine/threonine-protein kinase
MAAVKTILAGRYRLEEVVGRGGMSTVYRATDQVLGRTVAVKILLAALADQDPTYSARFEREARAAAALNSSAVVSVYDTGVDAGSHYIVMEYIAGRSLDERLRDGRPLDLPEALRIAGCVADALAAAHERGILHRDIKPANVMVADDGTVKVLDFGIARTLDGTTITQAASVVGTAAYMAPERALGRPGDARADIYSLGCLVYAMLTGAPPFGGEISAAVLHQQINAQPRSAGARRRGISPELDALILSMLAKSPDARPATAAEVRDEITRLARASGAASPTAATAAMTAATAVIGGVPPPRPSRPAFLADHRRRAVLMALLTGVVALIALALLGGGGSSRPSAKGSHRAPSLTRPASSTGAGGVSTPSPNQAEPQRSEPAPGTPSGQGETPPGQGGDGQGQNGD